jgi:MFS family permease
MQTVFLYSFIPGSILILLLVFKLPPIEAATEPSHERFRWRTLDGQVKGLLICAGGLALATTPEAFLVLWAYSRGLEVVWVPLLWAAAHAARAVVATPAGALSDRVGRVPVVVSGWLSRVVILVALAMAAQGSIMTWVLFLLYAIATVLTEGAERALIGDFAPDFAKATTFGFYHMISGIMAFPGALLFGALWEYFTMQTAFVTAAMLTLITASAFVLVVYKGKRV